MLLYMQRKLLAIGIVSWALLAPGVCQAFCLLSAPAPTHAACHEAPATDRAPVPDPHSEIECCDEVIFATTSYVHLLEGVLGPLLRGVTTEAKECEFATTPTAFPRPPDLANSPYLRVTPPRLVYQG